MLESFTGIQKVYIYCIIVGGVFFLVRLSLTFLGMGDHHDIDHAGDVDGHDHPTPDADFKLLSIQGFTAFLLIFGTFGLAAARSSHLSTLQSCTIGVLSGLAMVWLVNKLFHLFSKMQHAGNIDLKNAIGQVGSVYLTITSLTPGKVTVLVQGRLMTLDATTNADSIPTGTQVRVVAILNNMLLVEPLK